MDSGLEPGLPDGPAGVPGSGLAALCGGLADPAGALCSGFAIPFAGPVPGTGPVISFG